MLSGCMSLQFRSCHLYPQSACYREHDCPADPCCSETLEEPPRTVTISGKRTLCNVLLKDGAHGAQDLEKKEAVAEKKRESIMVGLNQTKGQVAGLEAALARNQVDLEKAHFELDAVKGAAPKPQSPTLRHDVSSTGLSRRMSSHFCHSCWHSCALPATLARIRMKGHVAAMQILLPRKNSQQVN